MHPEVRCYCQPKRVLINWEVVMNKYLGDYSGVVEESYILLSTTDCQKARHLFEVLSAVNTNEAVEYVIMSERRGKQS